ncbi:hypothetical protein [Candidatus Uabimicrobium amorphum]|uniref:Uncharacterized protein n=1 Tax=Uabimicrobium amorphum TaxID=2596890 RepID=A0A5S9IL71_UABAM|nr:hypothetical protein [Candidatus Uabimicrobium amorphum]BBM83392.1 hypothetical protein UABAM_01744 [Candidatus Uabimicrobium amorphum]
MNFVQAVYHMSFHRIKDEDKAYREGFSIALFGTFVITITVLLAVLNIPYVQKQIRVYPGIFGPRSISLNLRIAVVAFIFAYNFVRFYGGSKQAFLQKLQTEKNEKRKFGGIIRLKAIAFYIAAILPMAIFFYGAGSSALAVLVAGCIFIGIPVAAMMAFFRTYSHD